MRKRGPDRKSRGRAPRGAPSSIARGRRHASHACRAASPAARGSRKPPRLSALRSPHGERTSPPPRGFAQSGRERAPERRTISMTATTEQRARSAPLAHAFPSNQSDAEGRFACNALYLPLLCRLTRCRRTRRCGGDPQRCLVTHQAAVPPDARRYVEATLVAARYNRVHAGSGTQWLRENYSCEAKAFNAWAARFQTRGWGRPTRTGKAAPSR